MATATLPQPATAINERLLDFLDNNPTQVDLVDDGSSDRAGPAAGADTDTDDGAEPADDTVRQLRRVVEPESDREPAEAAAEETDETSAEESDEEVVAAAAEEEETTEETDRGINTLADMAKEFDMPEDALLEHLEVTAPDGTKVTLKAALDVFQNAPESARRWSDIAAAEQRIMGVDQDMQAANAETAKHLAANLQVAIDLVQSDFAGVNWAQLEQEDTPQYLLLKGKLAERNAKIAAGVDSLKGMEAQRDQAIAQQNEGMKAREQTHLISKMPEWADAKVAQPEMEFTVNFLRTSGFEQEEINQMTDHRYLLVAYQAAKFYELQTKAPSKIASLKNLPPTRPTLKAGARRTDPRTAQHKTLQRNVTNLKRSGSERDAAKLLEDHI